VNVLYLHSHDTGRYIQPHGYPVATPSLQKLAEEGCFFRDAHCVAPTCSPSRAGLLTGEYAHQAGMVALAHRGGRIIHPERHLANFLGGNGYETVLAGMSHLGDPGRLGYQVRREGGSRDGRVSTDYAIDYLRKHKAEKPFFLDVGFVETHRTEWVCHGFNQEHHDPKDGDGNAGYVLPPAILPDTASVRRDWLDYRHSAERLDDYYGQILKALDESGLADNTLVLATTDHGIAFPGHKCKLTAHGTGVLFILRAPGKIEPGQVTDALVSHVDFYPTLCELLGLEKPDWLQGRSLLPLLSGEIDSLRNEVFAEVTFHAAFEPKRSVRTKRWNYIRNFSSPSPEAMPNCDDGHSKRLWMEHGMQDRINPREELYDLVFDPQEMNNLADNPACESVKTDLRNRLAEWMERTDDPILRPDPAGLPLPQKVDTETLQPGGNPGEWDSSEWAAIDHEV